MLTIVLATLTLLIAVVEVLSSSWFLLFILDADEGLDGVGWFFLGVLGGPGLVSAVLAVCALVARRRPLGLLLSSLGLFASVSPPIVFVVALWIVGATTS